MPGQGPSQDVRQDLRAGGHFYNGGRNWHEQMLPPPSFMNDNMHPVYPRYNGYQPGQLNQGFRGNNWTNNPHQHHSNFSRNNSNSSRNQRSSSSSSSSSGESSRHTSSSRKTTKETRGDVCCVCRDLLQNCAQIGVHLCDGGSSQKDEKKREELCRVNSRLGIIYHKQKNN